MKIGIRSFLPSVAFVFASAYGQTNVFNTTGNAGIGTTSPAYSLDIQGSFNGSTATALRLKSTHVSGYGGGLRFDISNGVGASYTAAFINAENSNNSATDGGLIRFYTAAEDASHTLTQRMVINSLGEVGIGTSAPLSKLEVSGASVSLSANAAYNFVSTQDHSAYRGVYLGFDSSGQIGVVGAASGGGQSHLAFWTHSGSSNREVARFDGNGEFGIGTTTPEAGMHLKARFSGLPAPSGATQLNAVLRVQPIDTNLALDIGTKSAVGAWLQATNRTDLSQSFPILLNPNGGNVGIGTASPTHKLAVNGTIRAKEVIVDTGWADHVFAADYRLAPLSEVEQHIQQRGHLPDVPSAADVAARGVSVGEMQKILLQKIEELTLHQIEQEKRLNSQAERLRALEAENAHLRTR